MNSRLGVYVSLKRDCAPGRCILCVVYLCCIQTACVERELNGGGLKPGCLQTTLTLTLLLQYKLCVVINYVYYMLLSKKNLCHH